MQRIVWYPDGSPAEKTVKRLPGGFEGRPLSARTATHRLPGVANALVVDLEADAAALAALGGAKGAAMPVIGLVPPKGNKWPEDIAAFLPRSAAPPMLARALEAAMEHERLGEETDRATRELAELNEIGVSLSAERDTDALLALILTKARAITRSDAGSIYLREESPEGPVLRFKLPQNDSVKVPFEESTVPISGESVAGHVAATGETLRLDDAYAPPPGAPYRINRSFDQKVGYRTKSMLVVPMRTPQWEIIGVLQLINCRQEGTVRFASLEAIEREAVPYNDRYKSLAESLASQAAVALQNSRLLENIQSLFEDFVQASVRAIEARDPTTSGHSERVAKLTVALAKAVDRLDAGPLRKYRFGTDDIKAIRYASLLHDFGKIRVREQVLTKAKKLHPYELELIEQRAEIIRRGIRLRHGAARIRHLLEEGRDAYLRAVDQLDAEQAQTLAELGGYLEAVDKANEPAVMAEDAASRIQHVAARIFLDDLGTEDRVITPKEAGILSIPRGSLTPEEFEEIQQHAAHTYEFLRQLPWTPELKDVPRIARSHHEKLNRKGYPDGIGGEDIPVQSRMMTITDIYDALTASDRPYKKAMSPEKALEILGFERKAGAIDPDLLDVFIELRPWERLAQS